MRRTTRVLLGAVLVLAMALPAFGWYRILSDEFDRSRQCGVAIVHLDSNMYAEIVYRDMDRSMSYTARDLMLSIRCFRRGGTEFTDRTPTLKHAPR